jgi:hypothetical protein
MGSNTKKRSNAHMGSKSQAKPSFLTTSILISYPKLVKEQELPVP